MTSARDSATRWQPASHQWFCLSTLDPRLSTLSWPSNPRRPLTRSPRPKPSPCSGASTAAHHSATTAGVRAWQNAWDLSHRCVPAHGQESPKKVECPVSLPGGTQQEMWAHFALSTLGPGPSTMSGELAATFRARQTVVGIWTVFAMCAALSIGLTDAPRHLNWQILLGPNAFNLSLAAYGRIKCVQFAFFSDVI